MTAALGGGEGGGGTLVLKQNWAIDSPNISMFYRVRRHVSSIHYRDIARLHHSAWAGGNLADHLVNNGVSQQKRVRELTPSPVYYLVVP